MGSGLAACGDLCEYDDSDEAVEQCWREYAHRKIKRTLDKVGHYSATAVDRSQQGAKMPVENKDDEESLVASSAASTESDVCSICLDELVETYQLNRCGHVFHAACLESYWVSAWPRLKCPYCRSVSVEH